LHVGVFDLNRRRRKINVLFFDAHASAFSLPRFDPANMTRSRQASLPTLD
jgi:prepilin-type processing-associated H-X9-DG protein